ncbi:DNRLRE domain-containing protein [Clostridium sp. MSJ-11]|uniref:DNRLRE domain-containing protein n=1 Tax=Clostridium mobile TaxID=2841512 RepID=A0ABS6EEM7_9CLOT|nr:DNRLRE domain-containing protein [Clostridium mobile]MBU5483653.1 DNRLRE domain-containing protein [Clostridium mobile]
MPYLYYMPNKNLYISQYYSNTNFNGAAELFVGKFLDNNDIYQSLLQFDISPIPIGANITSATLKLYIYRNDAPLVTSNIGIYRFLNNFDKNSVTFANVPLIENTPVDVKPVTSQVNTFINFDLTTLVKNWLTGLVPNYGILIKEVNNAYGIVGFRSTFFNNSDYFPVLEVQYDLPCPCSGGGSSFTEYPVEIVTTTNNFTGSTPIPLGAKQATFGVMNIGVLNSAEVILQLSSDGITWIDNILSFVSTPTFVPGDHLIMTTTGHLKYARVSFKSKVANQPATLSIYAATVG